MSKLNRLTAAINRDAWDYLQEQAPEYAEGVKEAVKGGETADSIYYHVLNLVGVDRQAIALRCRQAAIYLIKKGETP